MQSEANWISWRPEHHRSREIGEANRTLDRNADEGEKKSLILFFFFAFSVTVLDSKQSLELWAWRIEPLTGQLGIKDSYQLIPLSRETCSANFCLIWSHTNWDKVIEVVLESHGKIVRPIQPDSFGERVRACTLLRFSPWRHACVHLSRYTSSNSGPKLWIYICRGLCVASYS